MSDSTAKPLDAEILIAMGCAHCPIVVEGLTTLVKEGLISRLVITNSTVDPERAQALGVCSVPWTRIGHFILQGNYSSAELRCWAQRTHTTEGIAQYIQDQLRQGNLTNIEHLVHSHPEWLKAMTTLLDNEGTEMQIRLGMDAVFESLTDTEALLSIIPELETLSQHASPRIRGDATHYLALTNTKRVLPILRQRLNDENDDVKAIAAEGIELIQQLNP